MIGAVAFVQVSAGRCGPLWRCGFAIDFRRLALAASAAGLTAPPRSRFAICEHACTTVAESRVTDRPSQTRRATADMVARAAQVSRVAVSRAFNPHASIQPEKRARILKVAAGAQLYAGPGGAGAGDAAVAPRGRDRAGRLQPLGEPGDRRADHARCRPRASRRCCSRRGPTCGWTSGCWPISRGFNPDSVIAFAENVGPDTLARVLIVRRRSTSAIPTTATARPGSEGAVFDRLNVMQRTGIEQAVALVQGYGCRRLAYLEGDRRSLANTARGADAARGAGGARLAEPVSSGGISLTTQPLPRRSSFSGCMAGADAIFAANDVGRVRRDRCAAVRARAAGAGGRQGRGLRRHRPGALAELQPDHGAGGPDGAGAGAGVADPAAAEGLRGRRRSRRRCRRGSWCAGRWADGDGEARYTWSSRPTSTSASPTMRRRCGGSTTSSSFRRRSGPASTSSAEDPERPHVRLDDRGLADLGLSERAAGGGGGAARAGDRAGADPVAWAAVHDAFGADVAGGLSRRAVVFAGARRAVRRAGRSRRR